MDKVALDTINHLSDKAKKIFKYHVEKKGQNRTPGRVAEVTIALEALDRLDQIKTQLDKQGLIVKSNRSGLSHPNALIRVEAQQRKFLMKQWRKLGLHRKYYDPYDI